MSTKKQEIQFNQPATSAALLLINQLREKMESARNLGDSYTEDLKTEKDERRRLQMETFQIAAWLELENAKKFIEELETSIASQSFDY